MKKIILFFTFIFLFNFTCAYSFQSDILLKDEFLSIFETYYTKAQTKKDIELIYNLDDAEKVTSTKIKYTDIIIGDVILTSNIINNNEYLEIETWFDSVYLLTNASYSEAHKECADALQQYYQKLPFSSPLNLQNKDVVISKFLIPLTKDKIIEYLLNKDISNADNCFSVFVQNEKLIEYPIIFNLTSELKKTPSDLFLKNISFKINFLPEFINPVKPINYNVFFKKKPIVVNSSFSAPSNCQKQELNSCYINYSNIQLFDNFRYQDPNSEKINDQLRQDLDNFKIINDFKKSSFENINTIDLLLDVLPLREEFCFKEENSVYNDVIFEVAKAYDLSLDETFMFWSILAEKTNCFSEFNKNLVGIAQIDLKENIKGTQFSLDPLLPSQLTEEEKFQYLVIGDFSNINEILEEYYKGNNNSYYKYGHKGKIHDDVTYFGFLVNALMKNKDKYGSVILYASDFLKEINFLVKNSREVTNKPYSFVNFITNNKKSIDYGYVMGSLMDNKDDNYKKKIYEQGDFEGILSKDTNLFVKAVSNLNNNTFTYIKTTKETRILINYLTLKRKYLNNSDFIKDISKVNNESKELNVKTNKYEKLNHKYWDTKKAHLLTSLENQGISLLLKKDSSLNNYKNILKIKGESGKCAAYVANLGRTIYLNGANNYFTGPNAWTYDTSFVSIDAYNLIWEAQDICKDKVQCYNVPNTTNCCYEDKSLQDGINSSFPVSDLEYLVDGSIIGLFIPGSGYNNQNTEYTHVGMYIGKSLFGEPLMAHSASGGQTICSLRSYLKNKIKILRIYVPKSTGITSFSQLKNIKNISTYVTDVNPNIVKFDPKTLEETSSLEIDNV